MSRLTEEPIRVDALIERARDDVDGAVALFLGTVRNRNQGRRVLTLEYHAYPEMAEAELEKIEREAQQRFDVSRVVVVHRTGRLAIGEAAVAVAVSAPHRGPAIDACGWTIDTLKTRVPIWKKETFEGGEVWVEPQSRDAPGKRPPSLGPEAPSEG